MKHPIELDFHQIQFEKHLKEETLKADKLNKALETIKLITDNEVSSFDINALNTFLNNATGFRNVGMSASALNLDEEYQLIYEASQLMSEYISLKDGKYVVDEYSLKEFYTDFLTDAELEIYNTLLKALKILNKVDFRYFQCINKNEIDKRKIRAIKSLFFSNR